VGAVFEQLDYIYEPSADVARDMAYLADVVWGRVIFAIDDGGTRIAFYQLTRPGVAGHFEGRRDF
jgi:hypothetical protein